MVDGIDTFNLHPVRFVGEAVHYNRKKYLRWISSYVKRCEKEDYKLALFRRRVYE